MHAGKIKCDLNSLLDLHQMSPSGHELSGNRGRGGLPIPAQGEHSLPEQHRQHGWEIKPAPSHCLLPEGCLGCLPWKRLVACIPLPPPTVIRARYLPLRARGCASSTHMPPCSSASQENLGAPHKTQWTQATLMTSALGQLQDHEGLLGQLQKERSALCKSKVHLAKRPVMAFRSPRLPSLGQLS